MQNVTSIRFDELGFRAIEVFGRTVWGEEPTFSCNEDGSEVWPWATFGWTPPDLRINLAGLIRILDEIVRCFLAVRPEGGRFRVDSDGARFADGGERFVEFEAP